MFWVVFQASAHTAELLTEYWMPERRCLFSVSACLTLSHLAYATRSPTRLLRCLLSSVFLCSPLWAFWMQRGIREKLACCGQLLPIAAPKCGSVHKNAVFKEAWCVCLEKWVRVQILLLRENVSHKDLRS